MDQKEFNALLLGMLGANSYQERYDLGVKLKKAFAEKQHEIDLLKAELAIKVGNETVHLTQKQVEWLHAYFDDGEEAFDTCSIQIKNFENGVIMFDPETPFFGWVYIQEGAEWFDKQTEMYDEMAKELLVQESPAMAWTAQQLTPPTNPYLSIDIHPLTAIDGVTLTDEMYNTAVEFVIRCMEECDDIEETIPKDVRETGEICFLWFFRKDAEA